MNDSISNQLGRPFAKRLLFICFVTIIITSFILSVFNMRKQNEIEETLSGALSYTLQDSVRNKDVVSIIRIINGFEQANLSNTFCIKLSDGTILSKDPSCELLSVRTYPVLFSDLSILISISSKNRDYFLYLAASSLILLVVMMFLLNKIRKASKLIVADVQRLGSNSLTQNFKFKEISSAQEKILENQKLIKEKEELNKLAVKGLIAQQVSHDIRSPLAALRVCAKEVRELPEEHRLLIRSAVQRIEDIANDLSGKKAESEEGDQPVAPTPGSPAEDLELHLLSSLVEPLISEKRLQHRSKLGIEIRSDLDERSYGLFARVNVKEFKRVLSNLINNAVEVFKEENGIITVGLSPQDDFSKIQIADNGKGIPPDILSKLAQRGNTFGKEGGSGLGLFHARTTVEKWGGEFRIESKFVGAKPGFRPDLKRGDYMESPLRNGQLQGIAPTASGTTITLLLPKQESPDWFVPKIHLEEGMTLVIVDDDQSIHQIWKERLKSYDKEKRIFLTHLSNPEQLRDWHELAGDKNLNILCLCDYEFLGCKKNGLDIIEELNISKQSVLVTSRYEEKDVRERCARLKIKLLPKPLAGFVPVELPSLHSNGHYDCVLIDDEEMVHVPWQIAAQGHGKRLKTYKGPEDFLREVEQFSKDTPIYIDSLLANNRKGEEVSKQFSELGFTNIFLATGKKPKDFPNLPWIKKIVGKDPPWG